MKIRGVKCDPEYLNSNSDNGYQITATVQRGILHLEASCVVVSDSSHVSPRYERYIVAQRVYDDNEPPTLAEQVAEKLGWDGCHDTENNGKYGIAHGRDAATVAKRYLRANAERVLAKYAAPVDED